MGTNYYLHQKPPCECCQRPFDTLHIGKSSAGWCFSLHVIPELGLIDTDTWFIACSAKDAVIKDEYDRTIAVTELIDTICNRAHGRKDDLVPFGYGSWDAFHESNQSSPGPNGLMRHKLDGKHCIAHGSTTWDAITGEFC